jgi:hypothetical protein
MFSVDILSNVSEEVKTWTVFGACFISSAIGVGISFLVFSHTLSAVPTWLVGFVISVVMLGVNYGAKYASEDSRKKFSPVDLIQYLSQGFLWPNAWPALAAVFNMAVIAGPPSQ